MSVTGAIDEQHQARAIPADELARRARLAGAASAGRHGAASAAELERWLLRERLAVRVAGGLAPTSRTVDIVTGIERT